MGATSGLGGHLPPTFLPSAGSGPRPHLATSVLGKQPGRVTRGSLPAGAAKHTGQWTETPEGAFFKVTVCLVCVFHSSASALPSLCGAFPASSASRIGFSSALT